MTRVLVVDDEAYVRELLRRVLSQWGYEVVEAENGSDALEKFSQTLPEVVLLDIAMPVMNGFEALKKLRQSSTGAATPVVLVTTLPANQGEPVAMSLGCQHYVSKPFDLDVLKSTIRVAVRESSTPKAESHEPPPETLKRAETQQPANTDLSCRGVLGTGIELVDEELGGGIPRQSLTLIEGPVGSGKSVLCQHLTHHILLGQEAVSYISSDGTESSFLARMSSIGREVSEYHRQGQLQINCLEEPVLRESPEDSLALVGQRLKEVPQKYQTIIVDSITNQVAHCEEKSLVAFFQLCKSQCRNGRTICLVTHYGLFEEKSWIRIRPLLDNHIRLFPKPMGRRLVKTLEVLKVNNVEVHTGNRIAFDVQSGTGILPIHKSQFTA